MQPTAASISPQTGHRSLAGFRCLFASDKMPNNGLMLKIRLYAHVLVTTVGRSTIAKHKNVKYCQALFGILFYSELYCPCATDLKLSPLI